MPPKAEKKEKSAKGDEAEAMVLQYLKSVNRPYASTDVSANLKNKVSKTEAQKALTALADKGLLTMKPYGKQTIFVYNQSQLPVVDPAEMARYDDELKELGTALDEARKELKSLQSDLAAQEALPETSEMDGEISRVQAENDLTIQALKPFRGEEAAPPMSAEDTAKIDKDWAQWRKEWVARRKVYNHLLGILQDGGLCGTNRTEFEEEQGVEGEDDDIKELEQGEFCKPPATVPAKRKPKTTSDAKTPAPSPAATARPKAKRARA